MLKRFAVSAIELPEDGPLGRLREQGPVDGLHLVPHAGMPAAEDYRWLRFYFDRATGIPVGVWVLERDGDVQYARLDDVERNPVLSTEDLSALSLETPDPRVWKIDIR